MDERILIRRLYWPCFFRDAVSLAHSSQALSVWSSDAETTCRPSAVTAYEVTQLQLVWPASAREPAV